MKKILVVEDEPDILYLYVYKFGKEGYQVDEAKDGQEAVDKIRTNKYDLVLLDIMLPKKNGVDVLKEIKSDKSIHQPAVYLLTNLAEDSIIKQCFDLGAVGYIIKSQLVPADVVKEVKLFFEKGAQK